MKYLRNFLYILKHKFNVAIEAIKEGMFLHALTHDASKFSPKEFKGYANKFFSDKDLPGFEKAWIHHYKNNPHHWQYWIDYEGNPIDIPLKYIKQMVVDWRAMSRKFGGSASEYYMENRKGMNLTEKTNIKIMEVLEGGD